MALKITLFIVLLLSALLIGKIALLGRGLAKRKFLTIHSTKRNHAVHARIFLISMVASVFFIEAMIHIRHRKVLRDSIFHWHLFFAICFLILLIALNWLFSGTRNRIHKYVAWAALFFYLGTAITAIPIINRLPTTGQKCTIKHLFIADAFFLPKSPIYLLIFSDEMDREPESSLYCMNNIETTSYKKRDSHTTSLQQQYLYISLFSFPIVVLFVKFFSDIWSSHMVFSYKLVAIFLVFVFISNFFSKLTIRILRHA